MTTCRRCSTKAATPSMTWPPSPASLWSGTSARPSEFAEVASMGMELLASPYLESRAAAFIRRRMRNGRGPSIWKTSSSSCPYMAVVDGFQHWVYAEASENVTAADLDQQWEALWERFLPGVDWSGLGGRAADGLAPQAAPLPVPVLLRGVRPGAARSAAGLAQRA